MNKQKLLSSNQYSKASYGMNVRGFTIIEVLIAIGITVLLLGITVSTYSNVRVGQALDKESNSLITVINQARNLSLASKNKTNYGVHFESGQLVLFAGSAYSASDPANVSYELNSLVTLSANLSGGSADVVFDRLSGKADHSGTITVSLVSDPSRTKTITIFSTGVVELN